MMINLRQMTLFVLLIPAVTSAVVQGAEADDKLTVYKSKLDAQQVQLQKTHEDATEKNRVAYLKALLQLKTNVQQEGNLDKTVAVTEEIARFEKEGQLPERDSQMVDLAEVQQAARSNLTKLKHNRTMRQFRLLEQYCAALERLQKDLVRNDNIGAAEQVKVERDSAAELMETINRSIVQPEKPTTVKKKPPVATAAVSAPATNRPAIPSDAVRWRGHHYLLVRSDKISFEAAKGRCEAQGGHLVYFETKDELDFVISEKKKRNNSYWVGASDLDSEGKWKWMNGRPVSTSLGKIGSNKYTNFAFLSYGRSHLAARNRSGYEKGGAREWVNGFVCEWDY
jgi:hypothetical protein